MSATTTKANTAQARFLNLKNSLPKNDQILFFLGQISYKGSNKLSIFIIVKTKPCSKGVTQLPSACLALRSVLYSHDLINWVWWHTLVSLALQIWRKDICSRSPCLRPVWAAWDCISNKAHSKPRIIL